MDFRLTDEQRLLADSARRWADQRCGFEAWQRSRRAGLALADARWADVAGFGWAALNLPAEVSGLDAGAVETGIVAEALGAALVAEPFVQTAVIAAVLLRALPPSPNAAALQRAIAERGLRVVLAASETAIEDHSALPATCAEPIGADGRSGWRLHGRKTVVSSAAQAGLLLVSAHASDGVALFAVDPHAAGVQLQCYPTVDAGAAADIVFDALVLPAQARLCTSGAAAAALAAARAAGLAAAGAEAVGICDRLLQQTLQHARQRHQFGQPIGSFQAVRHRLVDMWLQLEALRSLVLLATLRLAERDAEAPRALTAMKVKLGSAGNFIAQQAVQLHGAMGMTDDLFVGHALKRLLVLDTRLGHGRQHLQWLAHGQQAFV